VKLKLDENIGARGVDFLTSAGHDVMTVRDQNLGGATDDTLFEACSREGRILITLDHDFGNVVRFPPETSPGIVILEIGPRATMSSILARLKKFLALTQTLPVPGSLWIVEPGRVRIRLRDQHDQTGPHGT
jgi:predicted nuclease of predicted toxin-antitoxin system